eukprot:gene4813-7429_t
MTTRQDSNVALDELQSIDDLRIRALKPLLPPSILLEDVPLTKEAEKTVVNGRIAVSKAMKDLDDRLVVVVGPCSIHDTKAGLEYAAALRKLAQEYEKDLIIVMRVYFEKPRTTIGWKGLINDPDLNGTFNINKGLRTAREFLQQVNQLGLPCGCEFLDTITPQFFADLVSWGAIGARTTESQIHRELASGLSMPVGFKNGTGGDVGIAVDAVLAAKHPHSFLSVTKQGIAAIVHTNGNPYCHVIHRGSGHGTNYDATSIEQTVAKLTAKKTNYQKVVVDCSHGNSQKKHANQAKAAAGVAQQIAAGSRHVVGVMIESHLVEGNQKLELGNIEKLVYGQSITDECINLASTKV